MISDEILSALSRFFEGGKGPSHDELTRMFDRAKLKDADPGETETGKMKRVRAVLGHAIDHDRAAGERLVKMLVAQIKANGGFQPDSGTYAGAETIRAAQSAFRAEGCDLDPEGNLRPATLDNLHGTDLTDALAAYVRRARVGVADAALQVGTGKDLLEATARHVLVETTGSYQESQNFPMTLFQSFDRLGLASPPPDVTKRLDQDPLRAMQQCLWLLGCSVNKLRHAQGTGHGRPLPTTISKEDAQLAIQAMGLVSQGLLDRLRQLTAPKSKP